MWIDECDLGSVEPIKLISAVPGALERLSKLQFDAEQFGLVDGTRLGGLRLVAGAHMHPGASYILVVEEIESDGDIEHDPLFVTIEEHTAEQLVVLAVEPKKVGEPGTHRWVVTNPSAPTHLQYTSSRPTGSSGSSGASTMNLEINVAHLEFFGIEPGAHLELVSPQFHAEFYISMTGPRSIRYEVHSDRSKAGSRLFASLKVRAYRKLASLFLKALASSWLEPIELAGGINADPVEVLWQKTVGQLAREPKQRVQKFIDDQLAA